jgi:hypothetical protein
LRKAANRRYTRYAQMDPVDSNNCQSISGVHTVCTAASLLHRGAGFSNHLPRNRCAEYSTPAERRHSALWAPSQPTPETT